MFEIIRFFFYIKKITNLLIKIQDYFKCQFQHLKNSDENYDNLGLVFRSSEDDVFVYFDNFGKIEVYCKLISLLYNFFNSSARKSATQNFWPYLSSKKLP